MIALLNGQQQWRRLLEREGVAFRVLDRTSVGHVPPTGVLIVDGAMDVAGRHLLDACVERGAAVLAGSDAACSLLGKGRIRRTRLAYIVPDDSTLLAGLGVVDTDTTTTVPVDAQFGRSDLGRGAVYTGSIGRGQLVVLPFELSVLLSDARSTGRRFTAGHGRQPVETVSTVARGEVRRLVANCLRYLLSRQGLPYVRLSPFPPRLNGLCGLRVDTDAGDDASIGRTLDTLKESGVRASWFINTSRLPDAALLNRLVNAGQDIQLHCFRHRVFRSYSASISDIDVGRRLLADRGINVGGFAAPFGEWHAELQRAIADSGLAFSSEFAYCYDDLPLRPVIDNQVSAALQVPVHPICLGSLARASKVRSDVLTYYETLARHRMARREPCLVYEHPARDDESALLLRQVLDRVASQCLNWTTLSDYAKWWSSREAVRYACSFTPDAIELRADAAGGDFEVIVEHDGKEAWLPLRDAVVRVSELDWRPLPEIEPGPRPDARVRKFDFGSALRELQRSWQRNLQKQRSRL
jgi:peptidoglycan/xylan/chitin deacetylase (PgdA/CDA1 family)